MSDILKMAAAKAAVDDLVDDKLVVGVGTGSTVRYFIEALSLIRRQIEGCVPSSLQTEQLLKSFGLPVMALAQAPTHLIYVDGADEVSPMRQMIKGGGGALTREKIIAACAQQFVCIVDECKQVKRLGAFPVAVEVLPIARSMVARKIVALGGNPVYRENFTTDNGNQILDVYHLNLDEPIKMEEQLKLMPGVVDSGIFAKYPASQVIVATEQGIKRF